MKKEKVVGLIFVTTTQKTKQKNPLIILQKKYKDGNVKAVYVGVHKYYIISRKEWANEQYKGISIEDEKTKTWITNEGNGCVLLFEGVHFEIA